MSAFVVVFVVLFLPPQGECREWQDCRQRALDAAARQEYETFHDLAWRAVQTGLKNDPALMHLLARAQSLSGRPHDALVMLRRLSEMGVATDAATNDDFRGVRALGGWPALEAALAGRPAPAAAPEPERTPAVSETSGTTGAPPFEVARLQPGSAVAPAGLAYDAISKRFIIGDSVARKLKVVDQFSEQTATLAGEEAAGFGDITALEIDVRQGDLWVASAGVAGEAVTTLHKLQLISARLIEAYRLPDAMTPGRFTDVAVAGDGTILVLDSLGGRVFRLRPRSRALDLAAVLEASELTSIAPAGAVAYVAHRAGIMRVDLSSGAATAVNTTPALDVGGITRLRWHRSALIGIQQMPNAGSRIVRIRLDRAGRTAVALDVLEPHVMMPGKNAAAITGDVLYYLAGDGAAAAIRSISVR